MSRRRRRQPDQAPHPQSAHKRSLSVALGVGAVGIAILGLVLAFTPPASQATTTKTVVEPKKVYAGLSGSARIETPDGTIQMAFPEGSKIYFENLETDGKPSNPRHIVITVTELAPFRHAAEVGE